MLADNTKMSVIISNLHTNEAFFKCSASSSLDAEDWHAISISSLFSFVHSVQWVHAEKEKKLEVCQIFVNTYNTELTVDLE